MNVDFGYQEADIFMSPVREELYVMLSFNSVLHSIRN